MTKGNSVLERRSPEMHGGSSSRDLHGFFFFLEYRNQSSIIEYQEVF